MPYEGKSHHPQHNRVVLTVRRPPREAIDAIAKTYPAFVLDRLGKLGYLGSDIQSLVPGLTMCGPAVTVQGADLDVRRMAIDLAEPGDVLVIAAGGVTSHSCFGESTARKMQAKSMAGVVIDGATRDAKLIRSMVFPTFARGVTPRNYTYPLNEPGAVNVPVSCGEAIVNPGDLLFGDDDGVVVVAREAVAELGAKLVEAMKDEDERREASLLKPFGVEERLRSRGYIFERGD
jgi:4-hydroxy-4-methyl-2-oxoglutarate aldolase